MKIGWAKAILMFLEDNMFYKQKKNKEDIEKLAKEQLSVGEKKRDL